MSWPLLRPIGTCWPRTPCAPANWRRSTPRSRPPPPSSRWRGPLPACAASAASTASFTGRTCWIQITYYTLLGFDLCYFKMTKYWEYNGSVVQNPQVTTAGWLASGQGLAGWRYYGIISSTGGWRTWGGHWNGAHYSYRQGHFSQRDPLWGKIVDNKYPQTWITVYGNGSYSTGYTP